MVCDNPQDTSLVMSPLRDTRREEDKKEEVEEDIIVPEKETVKRHVRTKSLCNFLGKNEMLETKRNREKV